MSTCGWRLERKNIDDDDDDEEEEDELLATLSLEELRELEMELAELDAAAADVPVGLRQRDHTTRSPTGIFDRGALLRYWEDENLPVEPGVGQAHDGQMPADESRGKNVTASGSDVPKHAHGLGKNAMQDRKEGGSVLAKAPQSAKEDGNEAPSKCRSHSRKVGNVLSKDLGNKPEKKAISGGADMPSGNPIVAADALEQILQNHAGAIEVNLNNVEDISQETLLRFSEALRGNTHVRVFSLANTRADDRVAFAISKMLRENGSIRNLNIESNFISGQGILALLMSLQHNSTLEELRFHNQRHICGGQVEMEMVRLLRENDTLLKLGYQFDLPGPRMAATSILTRNQDQQRQKRLQIQKNMVHLPEGPVAGAIEPGGHISGGSSSVEHEPAKSTCFVTNNNNGPPLHPHPTANLTPEKMMMIVDPVKVSNQSTKGQQSLKKPRSTSKVKSGVNAKESADIIQELRSAPRQSLRKRDDSSWMLKARRLTRDDLMEDIRGSSIRSLKRVNLSQN